MKFMRNFRLSKDITRFRLKLRLLFGALFFGIMLCSGLAQQEPSPEKKGAPPIGQSTQVAERIEVQPVSSDQAIDRRLTRILEATLRGCEVVANRALMHVRARLSFETPPISPTAVRSSFPLFGRFRFAVSKTRS
jgi:hypothetical protein